MSSAIAWQKHNHKTCIKKALANAEATCEQNSLKLTPIRRQVLELIWSSHKPSKAYELLEKISQSRANAAPPTVYRALDFLLEAGLIHKIESMNAFIGCNHAHADNQAKFLICQACQRVVEIPAPTIDDAIHDEAKKIGFKTTEELVEINGTCQGCAEA